MLVNLKIRDFAIVDEIDVEFRGGMTVISGETGAGKSILIDALGLVLGERGGTQHVRRGARRAEFAAEFDIAGLPAAQGWLETQALDLDNGCLLRRVIGADGRSRAFVNGNAVPVAQLKALGELLVDIHGQHFHQSLGRRDVQRALLDHFAGLADERQDTELAFRRWRQIADRQSELLDGDADRASRVDLLTFQLQELDALGVADGEYAELHAEREKLKNSGRLADGTTAALHALSDGEPAAADGLIAEALRSIAGIADYDAELAPLIELLNSAEIQIQEATDSLRRYRERIDMDPDRQNRVEERLDAMHAIARKHRIAVDAIPELHVRLQQDLDDLQHAEERGRALDAEVQAAHRDWTVRAETLSSARTKAAAGFSAAVTETMAGLGMPGGRFEVSVRRLPDNQGKPWGVDDIEFLISANPGQPPQPLAKIASGGELSRMSLSIQVIASAGSEIPTMIFDEVDSGVGGGVAEMVGRRLAELAAARQVLCVTHLPQVACQADEHLRISKVSDDQATFTRLKVLNDEQRVEELARMLGGVKITRKTMEHAAEMLAGATRLSA